MPGDWRAGELNRVIHPYWQAGRAAIVSLMTGGCEPKLMPAGAAAVTTWLPQESYAVVSVAVAERRQDDANARRPAE